MKNTETAREIETLSIHINQLDNNQESATQQNPPHQAAAIAESAEGIAGDAVASATGTI